MVHLGIQQGDRHLVGVFQPALGGCRGQFRQQGAKGLQRLGAGEAGLHGHQGRQKAVPDNAAEVPVHVGLGHAQLLQKGMFTKSLRHPNVQRPLLFHRNPPFRQ